MRVNAVPIFVRASVALAFTSGEYRSASFPTEAATLAMANPADLPSFSNRRAAANRSTAAVTRPTTSFTTLAGGFAAPLFFAVVATSYFAFFGLPALPSSASLTAFAFARGSGSGSAAVEPPPSLPCARGAR